MSEQLKVTPPEYSTTPPPPIEHYHPNKLLNKVKSGIHKAANSTALGVLALQSMIGVPTQSDHNWQLTTQISQHTAEIQKFTQTWLNKSKSQAVEELASYSMETHRIPDPYYFSIDQDGDLFSPSAQRKIREVIRIDTRLGQLELTGFEAIEKWVKQNDRGIITWVSPPSPGFYPDSKIVISEIKYQDGKKILFNRAIILDINTAECLQLAQNLAKFSQNPEQFTSADQVRTHPLILDKNISNWIDLFAKLINLPEVWEGIKNGADLKAKVQALSEAAKAHQQLFSHPDQFASMAAAMMGNFSSSCPELMGGKSFGTAFEALFSASSMVDRLDKDFCIKCGACQKVINKIVRVGQPCPLKCGAIRQCA